MILNHLSTVLFRTRNSTWLTLSALSVPVVKFVETYLFADWEFARFLAIAIAVDTLLGFIKHWKLGTISKDGFFKLCWKLVIYGFLLVLTHIMVYFKVRGEKNGFFDWFDTTAYSAIMVHEAISIAQSMAIVKPGLFPNWLLKRLEAFDKSGNFKHLINTDDDSEKTQPG